MHIKHCSPKRIKVYQLYKDYISLNFSKASNSVDLILKSPQNFFTKLNNFIGKKVETK